MIIHCTKKLLAELKMKPDTNVENEEWEPLFSWHANVIVINRRKTVVLVNDENRYTVVLHGLKAKDIKMLDQLIFQAIKETFQAEGIKDEIIEKYLSHSKAITFSKTKDRTLVSRMNKACENIYFFDEYIENESLIQTRLSLVISRLLVGDGKNSYFDPNEKMYKDLEAFAGKPIISMRAIQLKVTLQIENHPVWRRLIVPSNRTFNELHDVLQVAFGWQDYHLHEFYIHNDTDENPVINLVCDSEAFNFPKKVEMKLETDIKLSEYIPSYKKITYIYDFGDYWRHRIEVEGEITDYSTHHPICVEGKGNTPPEDVGGESGYESFAKIMANPDHPEFKEMSSWGRRQGYEDFDIQKVNRLLKHR